MKKFMIALVFLMSAEASLSAEFCLVTVDTGRYSKDRRLDTKQLVEKFELEAYLTSRQRAALESDRSYYKFEEKLGFEPVTGFVYFVQRNKIVRCRFRTVPDESYFDAFVAEQAARRGEGVQVKGTKYKKTLSVSGNATPVPDGKPKIRWADFSTAYENGMIVWGDSNAIRLDTKSLARVARKARGKEWYLYLNPSAVPKELRNAYLTVLERQAGVKLQRYDNERIEDYILRRGLGENYLQLLRGLLFDIESAQAWTQWPKEGGPFEGGFRLEAKKKSQLSVWLDNFSPGRSAQKWAFKEADYAASAYVDFNLPPTLGSAVTKSVLQRLGSDNTLAQTLKEGRVACFAGLRDLDKSWMIDGMIKTRNQVSPKDLAMLSGDTKAVDSSLYRQLPYPFPPKRKGATALVVNTTDEGVRLCLSDATVEHSPSIELSDQRVASRSRAPIVRLQVRNAARLTNHSDETTGSLFKFLETVYDSWELRRYGLPGVTDCASLADHLLGTQNEENNNLQLEIRHVGRTLIGDCKIGSNLFGLLYARRMIAVDTFRRESRRMRDQ